MNYAANAPLRTGLLGFGLSGRVFHAPFLAADPQFVLSIIVTADPGRQAEARRLHPGARVVADADELFDAAGELDLVVIGTPPATHHPLARRAIGAGLGVVVDKPFAATSAEGEELVSLATSAGVPLTVFQNRRWDADFLTLKGLLDTGALAGAFRFESAFEWFKPGGARAWKAEATEAEGGGILFDLGTHLIDQALQLFGPVATFSAELATRHPSSAAVDDAFVSLHHASGVTSHLTMNSLAAQKRPRFRVLTPSTAYTKWGLDGQEAALKAGALPTDEGYGVEPASAWGVLGIDGAEGSLDTVAPERGDYASFYRLLGQAIATGSALPVDPADAVEVLRLIERLHERGVRL
ncbi:Gfo/Idh/MocA family protein [Subtercola boreus]|uniref:Oxidoreductase n=1 Tax=Subtercola boreus TaxID=120213 RepID=A0A3E0WBV5_9MICO|nr:Gfo/Idh/MocA family oxidoreductase [Subtercola boreus]RFA20631.1 oxidoreductase [Subtercola boreus]RFA20745.1 oxidoreductase [Subtercola boreus]RFA26956.1 oxidoreductase [Subtercola boreus]